MGEDSVARVRMATVTPIRPGIVIPVKPPKPKPLFACAVCKAPPQPVPPLDSLVTCQSCGSWMHHECYWGRTADADEWREYVRWLHAGADDEPCPAKEICKACQAKAGA